LEPPLSWANTELVDGDAIAAVQDMKRTTGDPERFCSAIRAIAFAINCEGRR
jgi:hypothetical protein